MIRDLPSRAGRALGLLLVLAPLAAACTPRIEMQPAALVPVGEARVPDVVLATTVTGTSSAGYARTLQSGTLWRTVGAIDQGRVLQPVDMVLTAEGAHMREAYIVVRAGAWSGFWLPVEDAFSPLRQPVPIEFERLDE